MLTLRKLSQKIKDMNKFLTMCIQHAVCKNYDCFPVQKWTPPFQTEGICHVTPNMHSLFHEQKGTNALETGQADSSVYELFNYFYRNVFLSRNLNSVTNNSNNS